MPLSRIEIEELGEDWWVADVEVGGLVCKRDVLRVRGFEALLAALYARYRDFKPDPSGVRALVFEDELPVRVVGAQADLAEAALPDIEDLRRQARELGIVVDLRWRERTLQAEIDMVLAR